MSYTTTYTYTRVLRRIDKRIIKPTLNEKYLNWDKKYFTRREIHMINVFILKSRKFFTQVKRKGKSILSFDKDRRYVHGIPYYHEIVVAHYKIKQEGTDALLYTELLYNCKLKKFQISYP